MKHLKILILNDYSYIEGGAGKVAIASAIKLAKNGHEVVFFSAVGPISDELVEAPLKEVICLNQKDILNNPNKLDAILSGIYNRKAVRRLKELFYQWIPDIAHFHGISKALSWAPINTAYSYKIPIVYTLHDYGLLCPNLGIYNYRLDKLCDFYKQGCAFKCLITNCDKRSYFQKLWRWIRYHFSKNILDVDKKISSFIAVSNFIEKLFKDYLPSNKPVKVIYNPASNNQVSSKSIGIKKRIGISRGNDVVFLFVGRLSLEKGVDLLLKAIREVDAKLVIIGDGEMMEFCKDVSKEAGEEKIKLLGWQDEEVISSMMKCCNALIVPSKVMETAGIVVIEAAKYSLPSIVANQGGLAEFIKDGINSLYFKAGSVKSLIYTMEKIINDPLLLEALGENARQTFEDFGVDINTHVRELENFYIDSIKAAKYRSK